MTVSDSGTGAATADVPLESAKSSSLPATEASTMALPPLRQTPPPPPAITATDVTLKARDAEMTNTLHKFDDIYKVNKSCDNFHVDPSQFDETVNVKGRLNHPDSIRFFREIGASQFILDTLKNGHHPTLIGPVPAYEIENHGSFRKHIDFAMGDLLNLIAKGRVEIVEKKPLLINPLHVVVQRLKKRLILDCSILNKYIKVPKIKYENHEVGLQYFKKGCYIG